MRLFGTFKTIEAYVIITAIFLLYTFDQLCEKRQANMIAYWRQPEPEIFKPNVSEIDTLTEGSKDRRPLSISNDPETTTFPPNDVPVDITTPAATTASIIGPDKLLKEIREEPGNGTRVPILDSSLGHRPTVDGVPLPTDPTTTLEPEISSSGVPKTEISAEARQGLKDTVLGDMYVSTESSVAGENGPRTLRRNPELDEHPHGMIRIENHHPLENISTSTLKPAAIVAARFPPASKEVVAGMPPLAKENVVGMPPLAKEDDVVVMHPLAKEEVVAEEKPAGFFDNLFHLFGSKNSQRSRRNTLGLDYNKKYPIKENQTYFGDYRCEKAFSPSFNNVFASGDEYDAYQGLFSLRYWAIFLLAIHLILVVYHAVVNFMHRVPTSQRFNRIFAAIGLLIWDSITIWIIYLYLTWHRQFLNSPFIPDFPSEFFAFFILSLGMNFALMYELLIPMVVFTSYEITPRHPRLGYIPAAQSENEYIDGIIRQLERGPIDPLVETHHVNPNYQKVIV